MPRTSTSLGLLGIFGGLFLAGDSIRAVHRLMPGQEALVIFACFGVLLVLAGCYMISTPD